MQIQVPDLFDCLEASCTLVCFSFRLLLDTAANFQNSCEEVTLGCSAENLKFENYREDEPGLDFFSC